jgi:hypothetical protein
LKHRASYILLLILLAVSFSFCRKNGGTAAWDVDILTPLIKTELGINNIIADSLIQTQSDSSLTLVYDNTLYNLSVDSLVEFPDTITHQFFHIPVTITANPGQMVLNITDNKNLNLESAQLTQAIVKSGAIQLKIRNTIREKMLCTYQIPCANLNGAVLEITELIPAATAAGPYEFVKIIDISGYNINLKGPNNISYNKLTSVTKAWVNPSGSPVSITYNDSLLFDAKFNNVIIAYAKGYFGTTIFETGSQTANFDLFNKIISGQLSLEDVKMKLTISNGFGVDARFIFNKIQSINSRTNITVSLASPLIGSMININRASETYNPDNPVTPSVFVYDLSTSNIKQLIENLPDKIGYSLDITTNPLGNVSTGNDFVYNSAGFNASLNMEIPLSIISQNLTLVDTLDFNLDPQQGYSVNNGTLTLLADNGFPLASQLQIYILNSENVVTDSLFSANNTINAAYTNSANIVTQKRQTKLYIPISNEKINSMYSANKVIVKARFDSPASYTKIYKNYALALKLTGDFNMTVNNE